jgi:hypothetical protein
MGNNLAGMAREINQQIKFLGGKVNVPATDRDFVGRQIDAEITDLNQQRLFVFSLWGPTQIGAHARQQFLDPERLGDIVVGASIERLDFGLFLALATRMS